MSRFLFLSSCFAFSIVACTDTDQQMNNNPCGDGVCDDGETHATCPEDCPGSNTCGDGVCGSGETHASCPQDCTCGDGTCEPDETEASCPQDCTPSGPCGDGICESTETMASCPADCDTSLSIQNNSSWVVGYVFIWPCGTSAVGNNQIAAPIQIDGKATVAHIPPGCYNQGAVTSDETELWESDNQQLTVLAGGWLWTLTNATAQAAN